MPSRFSRVYSAQPYNLKGHIVTVEIDLSPGLHAFNIVGLPDKAVEEARDRVGSALKNSDYNSPKHSNQKTIVSLAPAEIKKEGSFFDVAIALGYLLSEGDITFEPEKKLFLGELALNGEMKPIRGTLPLVQTAKEEGFNEVYVPHHNKEEAALVEGITVYPIQTLEELVTHLDENQKEPASKLTPQTLTEVTSEPVTIDSNFSEIRGQEIAKRGLEIAASGGHNVLMSGPPGTGKTMLARAFSHILPELDRDNMLEVTGIHSIAGTLDEKVMTTVPFRSPHHTSSYVSVIGGGAIPKPGEATLAHKGVLFLDEFPEFDRRVLESLRQPLEDRVITIARAQGTAKFPASFILIAAMNPCPCGNFGSQHKGCVCTAGDLARYKRKLSGPILDRIDISLIVEHIDYEKLSDKDFLKGESSLTIRDHVKQARAQQKERFGKLNSELSAKDLEQVELRDDVKEILNQSAEKLKLSPRSYHRVIKLARTIADLGGKDEIETSHILEALQYRPRVMQ